MKLTTFTEPDRFLALALPILEAQESANNLILGITIRLQEKPGWTDQPPYLAVVQDDRHMPYLFAAITPPLNLLLASQPGLPEQGQEQSLRLLVENLLAGGWPVPGVNAESNLSRRFAEQWTQATGRAQRIDFEERIYELRVVIPPPSPPGGFLRLATEADFDTLLAWKLAFHQEIHGTADTTRVMLGVGRQLENQDLYLWEDGGPASMAQRTRPTPRGASVGSVYTPPEKRGRGYASVCVAALSQHILDTGKQFCNLFTDLANPVSNSIYQKIGYRPVCDFTAIVFPE